MSRIGYARVSSYGQSLEVQLEKLQDCDRTFQEKQSARTDAREQLQLCLDYVRDGDHLVITKLDRLARSTRDLLNIMQRLEDKQVNTSFHSLRHTVITHLATVHNVQENQVAAGLGQTAKGGVYETRYTKHAFSTYAKFFDLINFDNCYDSKKICSIIRGRHGICDG